MALSNMRELLRTARAGGWGIGAFNVANMESVLGVLDAAEELRSPVILQVSEPRLAASPLWIMGPMMLAAARRAAVPVGVHYDHGCSRERIREALDLGFTSVMFDGSHLPLEENIRVTKEVVREAGAYGASVEAEVGALARREDGGAQRAACAAVPDCLQMIQEAGVDALAVAFGNAHGVYAQAPALRFDILEALRDQTDTPLVLHGGTGLQEADFQRAISLGMCKLNIATAVFQAAAGAQGPDLFAKLQSGRAAVAAVVMEHIRVFGSAGKEAAYAEN